MVSASPPPRSKLSTSRPAASKRRKLTQFVNGSIRLLRRATNPPSTMWTGSIGSSHTGHLPPVADVDADPGQRGLEQQYMSHPDASGEAARGPSGRSSLIGSRLSYV